MEARAAGSQMIAAAISCCTFVVDAASQASHWYEAFAGPRGEGDVVDLGMNLTRIIEEPALR